MIKEAMLLQLKPEPAPAKNQVHNPHRQTWAKNKQNFFQIILKGMDGVFKIAGETFSEDESLGPK
jgi:hypothetical protein